MVIHLRSYSSALCAVLCLAGCAAAGVPHTNDPYEKLNWAGGLVHVGSRPVPAEALISEAIAIFEQRNDELGLAAGYRAYASFFASPAIEGRRQWYAQYGFRDKAATLENRFSKSIEYFQKAEAIYTRHNRSDWLTYVNLNMGLTYQVMGDLNSACRAFERSEANHRATAHFGPDVNVTVDYAQVLTSHKRSARC